MQIIKVNTHNTRYNSSFKQNVSSWKDRAYLSTDIVVLSSDNPTEIEGAQRIGFETVQWNSAQDKNKLASANVVKAFTLTRMLWIRICFTDSTVYRYDYICVL